MKNVSGEGFCVKYIIPDKVFWIDTVLQVFIMNGLASGESGEDLRGAMDSNVDRANTLECSRRIVLSQYIIMKYFIRRH
jgi:hypothetical protein